MIPTIRRKLKTPLWMFRCAYFAQSTTLILLFTCMCSTTRAQGPQGPQVPSAGFRHGYHSSPAVPISTSGTTTQTFTTTHQRTSDAHLDPDNPNNNNDICIGGEAWCSLPEGNERLALEAIRTLHRQLDDDKNGNIDLDESDEFLREELKYERDYEKRQKAFHAEDNQVSVKELWETWAKSEVHNWTVEQTVEWISLFVGLPQYKEKFIQLHINGTYLPRLAVNHQNLLSATIGIKDLINKQKIALKAQDVVLFGPPKDRSNTTKDAILITLLVVALAVCYLVYNRYKDSQRDLTKMMKDMAELSKAEQALVDLQKEWKVEKEKTDHLIKEQQEVLRHSFEDETSLDELTRLREEVGVLRNELQRAEVELQDKCWVPPPALQHWLQLTYELELKSYNKKKASAERQLKQAKDACDKLKKKRSSLMGAFVSTHGRSIDDVDKAILEARTALTEITHELQERMNRWKQIELLANCSIVNNPGLSFLENHLRGIGKPPSYVGPGSVMSNSQDDIDDDGASSIYCPSAVHKLISTSTYLMFPGPQTATPFPAPSRLYQQNACELPTLPFSSGQSFGGNYSCGNGSSSASGSGTTSTSHGSGSRNYATIADSPSSKDKNSVSGVGTHSAINPNSQPLFDMISATEDSVSAPTSNLHMPIMRSKSVSSMLSLKERGASRESSKESSTAEDDVTIEGVTEMSNARDRRVTFGVRTDHRNGQLVRSFLYNSQGGPNGPEPDSKESEDSRKVSPRMPLSSHSVDNAKSEESKRQKESKEEPDLIKVPSRTPRGSIQNGEANKGSPSKPIEKLGFWKAISKFVRKNDGGLKPSKSKSIENQNDANASTESPVSEATAIPNKKKTKPNRRMSNLFSSLRRSNSTKGPSKSAKSSSTNTNNISTVSSP